LEKIEVKTVDMLKKRELPVKVGELTDPMAEVISLDR